MIVSSQELLVVSLSSFGIAHFLFPSWPYPLTDTHSTPTDASRVLHNLRIPLAQYPGITATWTFRRLRHTPAVCSHLRAVWIGLRGCGPF